MKTGEDVADKGSTMNAAQENREPEFDYRKSLKKPLYKFIDRLKYIDIYVNRPLAGLLVRAVYNSRITPNGLTVFSFILGLLGAISFTRGQYPYFVIGGVLAQLSSIVDGADGMLARARNQCSDFGAHLDLYLDRLTDFCLFLGIAWGIYIQTKSTHLLALGILASSLYFLNVNLFYIIKSYRQTRQTGETGEARAIMIWLIVIFAVLNRLDFTIYVLLGEAVIANIVTLVVFINLARKQTP